MKKTYLPPHTDCFLISVENLMGLPESGQNPPGVGSKQQLMFDDEPYADEEEEDAANTPTPPNLWDN